MVGTGRVVCRSGVWSRLWVGQDLGFSSGEEIQVAVGMGRVSVV